MFYILCLTISIELAEITCIEIHSEVAKLL